MIRKIKFSILLVAVIILILLSCNFKNMNIEVDFLDRTSYNLDIHNESFINLLNTNYKKPIVFVNYKDLDYRILIKDNCIIEKNEEVNDENKLEKITTVFLEEILNENHKVILIPAYSNTELKLLRDYNLNSLTLLKNSVIINKSTFDLLVPKILEVVIWISVLLAILVIIIFIYMYFYNKKNELKDKVLLRKLIQKNKIKNDFIITMSHELRTPLNIIINSNKLLKLRVYNDKYDRDFFQNQINLINKNSNRLLKLINNLIDVNKIETGCVDTIFKNENIVEVVEDTTMSVVDLANSYNIEVIFDTEEEEIITAIDRNKIERIILNLLSNSIKFTNDGGYIYVNLKKERKNIIIEVKDNGIGMSKYIKKHLFEKFKRVKSYSILKREHAGIGLGLFIVKAFVDIHNGSINVESEINKGTKFTIKIPQRFIDNKNTTHNLINTPLDYTTKIELSDIYDKDK